MKICKQCGKELPNDWITDVCLECSIENVKNIFEEYPDVKEAFFECYQKILEELKVQE